MNEKRELSAKILVLNEEKQKMNGFWLLLLKHSNAKYYLINFELLWNLINFNSKMNLYLNSLTMKIGGGSSTMLKRVVLINLNQNWLTNHNFQFSSTIFLLPEASGVLLLLFLAQDVLVASVFDLMAL